MIKQFVAAWYLALDNHAPTEDLAALLTDDVQMIFPEATLPGIADFKAGTRRQVLDGTEAPGVINIFFDENHNVVSVDAPAAPTSEPDLKVVVAWQASWFVKPATKAKRTSLDATQAWTRGQVEQEPVRPGDQQYNAVAAPFAYAPGFARL